MRARSFVGFCALSTCAFTFLTCQPARNAEIAPVEVKGVAPPPIAILPKPVVEAGVAASPPIGLGSPLGITHADGVLVVIGTSGILTRTPDGTIARFALRQNMQPQLAFDH